MSSAVVQRRPIHTYVVHHEDLDPWTMSPSITPQAKRRPHFALSGVAPAMVGQWLGPRLLH